jgi:phospholipid/cholesterol/gamma-HCH transport system substrate-binding protein
MADLSKLATDQNAEFTKTQAALRKATSAIDSASIDSTLRSFKSAAANINTLTADLSATSAKLSATLDKVNNGQGSMGKLMNDPAMYDDIRKLLGRLDSLTADFKANPRKYIKLSIF